jgi:adenosylcobinamide kinase/adenosylcobinamide-phosphate guanylyltransferase
VNVLLVTGGARSGKSSYAQAWAEARPGPRRYLATARHDPADAEMAARIARHRADRAGRGWDTIETGPDLRAALAGCTGGVALVDCVTLWLSGLAIDCDWDERAVLAEVDAVAALLRSPPCAVAVVTNEVGSGVVPASEWGRAFRDLQGFANQRLAAAAGQVVLCVCGLPLTMKPCAR